ncbi:MAG: hypothetical protein NC086_06635 [Alistipes sp.]|nr:hypothetical protein [Alistipes sp.]
MCRKHMAMAVMIISYFLVSCARKPDVEERNGIRVAIAGHEDTGEIITNIPENASDNSITQRNLEIFTDYDNKKIEQVIEVSNGTKLFIDADIDVTGIDRVSQYEYLTVDITEEIRANLFQSVFSETADKAVYDERNDVWTLDIDPDIRNYFLYQISYSNGGATVPGEQILVLENRYYDLYPFGDNRLASVSDGKIAVPIDEATNTCKQVVNAIAGAGGYASDYVQAYGNNGRRPYYKIVFQQMLDGMPVSAYNDLTFLFDENGIEMVKGSLFSAKETGLTESILSPDEAVKRLREQGEFLNFEEDRVTVSQITLEYVVIKSPEGNVVITPVWRFWLGNDEDERNFFRQKILAIDALTGGLIWEERGQTM